MEQLQAQQEQNKVNVQIAINWSENGTVAQYSEESNIAPEDKLSFAEANELLKRMNDHLKDTMLGYDKTDYEITLYKENDADPYVYSGRSTTQTVERPDWMEEDEILIDRDNDYVLLRDPDENVKQIWTASGEFLSTVQLENETVDKAMEEYYHNISKGGFYIPDRIKEGYMEEDYDNLSKEDIEL